MFNRLLYRTYLFFGAMGHWWRRRLTPAGWLVFLGAIITAGLGADPDRAIAYQAFAILFCLISIAILCAPFFRVRLSARRLLPRLGTVGQPLPYSILVRNESARPQRGLTLLENLGNIPITFEEFIGDEASQKSFRLSNSPKPQRAAILKETPLPALPPKTDTTVNTELIPLKRGLLQLTGLTAARPDPLGLFRAFSKIPVSQTVLILPRRYPVAPIPLPGTTKYQLGGVALAMSVGESEEFVSLRDYRRGDPLRHIHWKSLAKTGKLIVREFEDEFFVRHALILDTFGDISASARFEEAVSVAASFACTVNTQDSLLDLLFVGPEAYCFTAGRGLAHSDQMLQILAAVQPCREKKFDDLQRLVLEHISVVSGCICVFLAWDAPRQELVHRLRALGIPTLVLVMVEPGGSTMVEPGSPQSQPEHFHLIEAGKVQESLAKL